MVIIPEANIRKTIRFAFWVTVVSAFIGHGSAIMLAVSDRDRIGMLSMSVMLATLFTSVWMAPWWFFFVHLLRRVVAEQGARGDTPVESSLGDDIGPRVGTRGQYALIIFILLLDIVVLVYHFSSPHRLFPFVDLSPITLLSL